MKRDAFDKVLTSRKRPPYSDLVAEKLRRLIERKKLKPGDKIPTEAQLCDQHGVSRTVIREAIVSLRSEGHLVARQGIGVFVAETNVSRFEVDASALRSLPATTMLMELRMAVETEAAGFCALRRTQADASAIRRHMEKVDARRPEPKNANVWYDRDFHLAIAKASKNSNLHQLLTVLAPVVIPRIKLAAIVKDTAKDAYYRLIHAEHERIVAAIERQDAEAARKHMRAHIAAAIERVRKLAEAFPDVDLRKGHELGPDILRSLVRTVSGDRV
jgi:GntR family transcriptional regulator, transcriptional repressor for pyruvate dehydrogenase complex